MGDYSGLWIKAKIKDEFIQVIDSLITFDGYSKTTVYPWDYVASQYICYPWLRTWADVRRASFIPFGALSYMPEEWRAKDGDNIMNWNKNTGILEFNCSLKNYDDEIGKFLRIVLSNTVEELYKCDALYYGNNNPTSYILKNGFIVIDNLEDSPNS